MQGENGPLDCIDFSAFGGPRIRLAEDSSFRVSYKLPNTFWDDLRAHVTESPQACNKLTYGNANLSWREIDVKNDAEFHALVANNSTVEGAAISATDGVSASIPAQPGKVGRPPAEPSPE